jgi:peptidoglycan/LPS O-acetylase OafA/YrhL
MVIFGHATHTINFPPRLIRGPSAFINGELGVRVFFVISGFLITTLLLGEAGRNGKINLVGFYKRRALRILPVYYFYIITIMVIVGWLGLNAIHTSAYISTLTFTTRLWGLWSDAAWPLMHSWSLAIEEQFYLTWPAILFFLGARIGGRIWVPLLILLAPVLRYAFWDKMFIHFVFPTQGDSIAFGCLLALGFELHKSQTLRVFNYHPNWGRIGAVVLIYLVPILVISFHNLKAHIPSFDRLMITFAPTLQCVGIAYLIGSFTTITEGVGYTFLNFRLIQWVGRLSYSIYIWQQVILIPKEAPVFPESWAMVRWISTFPQNLVFVFAIAAFSYYCIEKPFLSLKNKSNEARQQLGKKTAIAPVSPPPS